MRQIGHYLMTSHQHLKARFIEVLEARHLNVKAACEACGMHISTYYRWMQDDLEFKEAVEAVQEGIIDEVIETALVQAKMGQDKQQKMILQALAKRRGFVARKEVSGPEGQPLPAPSHQHVHLHGWPPQPKSIADWEAQVKESKAQLNEGENDDQVNQVIEGEVIEQG